MTTFRIPTSFPHQIARGGNRGSTGTGAALLEKLAALRRDRVRKATTAPPVPRFDALKPSAGAVTKPTTPTQAQQDHVRVADLPGVGTLRPGEVELLAGHGVQLGVQNGQMVMQRRYAPTAASIIATARGA